MITTDQKQLVPSVNVALQHSKLGNLFLQYLENGGKIEQLPDNLQHEIIRHAISYNDAINLTNDNANEVTAHNTVGDLFMPFKGIKQHDYSDNVLQDYYIDNNKMNILGKEVDGLIIDTQLDISTGTAVTSKLERKYIPNIGYVYIPVEINSTTGNDYEIVGSDF